VFRGLCFTPELPLNPIILTSIKLGLFLATVRKENTLDDLVESSEHNLLYTYCLQTVLLVFSGTDLHPPSIEPLSLFNSIFSLMKRFTVAGWPNCGAYKKARDAINGLAAIFPGKITANIIEHSDRDAYMNWLEAERASYGAPEHKTSPFCWLTDENNNPILPVIGGRDDAIAWCQKFVSVDDSSSAGATANLLANVDPWTAEHGYDYDLVVIGGGSGGLATGREAAKLGAKVRKQICFNYFSFLFYRYSLFIFIIPPHTDSY